MKLVTLQKKQHGTYCNLLCVRFPEGELVLETSQYISVELYCVTGHDRADVPDDSQNFFLTTSLYPLSFSNNVYIISTICMHCFC